MEVFRLFRLKWIFWLFRVWTQQVDVQHLIYWQGECVCDAFFLVWPPCTPPFSNQQGHHFPFGNAGKPMMRRVCMFVLSTSFGPTKHKLLNFLKKSSSLKMIFWQKKVSCRKFPKNSEDNKPALIGIGLRWGNYMRYNILPHKGHTRAH